MLELTPIPILKDNYLWVIHQTDSPWMIAVDPGLAKPAIDFAQKHRKHITDILVTHRHWDHTDGIAELVEHFNCRVIGPETPRIPQVNQYVNEGSTFTLHGVTFSVIAIPGHTEDHIAYITEYDHRLRIFSGDTLFSAGCGRLLGGSAEQLKQSLDRIKALPDSSLIYCTHEYTKANLAFAQEAMPNNKAVRDKTQQIEGVACTLPVSVGEEKHYNPFLRCNDTHIVQLLEDKFPGNYRTELEVFSKLRQWKDRF
ncbi:hydroxyacylglutathione hydrolase [Alteromonadaceae bacterium Bs31]|nr:hydroxyacylglutathione hydrolase [Alteromonadaceae bacterium Bs31]